MNRPDERYEVTGKKIGMLPFIGRLYVYNTEGNAWVGTATIIEDLGAFNQT